MGAGLYVGRVGGLAVALGIGAAVFTGAGVAYADDSDAKDAAPSSESAEVAKAETADAPSAEPDTDAAEEPVAQEPADEDPATEEPAAEEPAAEDVAADEPADEPADVAVDKDRAAGESEEPAEPVTEDEATDEQAEELPLADEPTSVVEVPTEGAVAEGAAAEETGAEETAAPAHPDAVEEEPAAHDEVQPAETVTTELSDPSLDQPVDGSDGPVLPTLATLFSSILSAGREATNESPTSVGDQVTTSLAEPTATQYPIPVGVTVEEWTPPLEWLQEIPILGPLLITPLVGFAHVIPFLGDVIHPVIGFPIDHSAPEGTPRARSFRVTSFDGTRIFVNFMPAKGLKAGEKAPTILNGPGLGLPGSTTLELDVDSFLPNDVVGIGTLRSNGYNVVTWDPRGEWRSEGVMHLNSPDLEGRDMSHIISYLATLPEVQLDALNDPRIGMTGASYGGGIQLATAAIDHRVDALVPTIAWNNLVDVLFPRDAVNSAWGTLLPAVLALTFAREHPRIFPVAIQGVLFGIADPDDIALVNRLSFGDQIKDITAPTLLIQGTVDTLFTLDQAHRNALDLIEAGTTTKVIWYCGGHGTCLSDYNDGEFVVSRTLNWLDRYVKGNESVDTGAQFEWVDQNGEWHSDEQYPATASTPIVATREEDSRVMPIIPALFGSGPNPLIITRGLIAALLGLPSAAAAYNSVNLQIPEVTELTHIVGAPEVTMTYTGDGSAKHVYAQIVDDETGLVLGNHATPIPVTLDGESHTATFSLEQVAHTLKPGQSVTVQIVTSTAKYLNFYSWGAIKVEELTIELPTRADAVASQEPVVAA
ncbi:ABC-2 type transport system ATP-binding protein [Mycolicibacterium iranicum]|uniref:ABC-2 type transport system ATP-binding protein n=1 Tax=Mycolicibacterium iranicum TaxID=912594 RepID=A0A839Q060_MYCIR|nr:CocE/NonD family hydrolase [Mycolicibacterium iranicum]MBB2989610.1 ABC-2 type transport system ATP-binding protein [Mycolicibacterium iranicum]